ncbi:helix-turn-helix transcriptional regulator [Peptostreptococcus canis]|uniref:HTH domain-containing protein n=1 Tax=Peptostreptococcus canis TaxID=1159213 RepID=A0ABR6TL37_9FIRM|nr:PAS domain-containing protein [Peptostreptococcus canis]MBC2576127.1 HTH domain-containing protein [Peptostreptococcus canis]
MEIGKYDGIVNNYDSFLVFLDTLAVIISEMFGSKCEVVISDLDNPDHSIISIYNGEVTGRKVGDPLTTRSEELIERSKGGYNINYKKANKRIKKEIKSSTIVINAYGKNISFCINYDCDDLTAVHVALKKFLSMGEQAYDEFDVFDNGQLVEQKFEIELEKINKSVVSMNKQDRLLLIKNLKKSGVFKIQKSVPYIAERLGVSRYTIYNYLNEIQKSGE